MTAMTPYEVMRAGRNMQSDPVVRRGLATHYLYHAGTGFLEVTPGTRRTVIKHPGEVPEDLEWSPETPLTG